MITISLFFIINNRIFSIQVIHVIVLNLHCHTEMHYTESMVSPLVKLPTECGYLFTASASLRRHLFVLLFFYVRCFVPVYARSTLLGGVVKIQP